MKPLYKDLIYLLACAVNDIAPDPEKVRRIDLNALYPLLKSHSLRAMIHPVLDKAGVVNKDIAEAYHKSLRKNILLDIERESISADFEKAGIWYLPLKGSLLKDLYPSAGMREMVDNDILIDGSLREKAHEIMLSRGYSARRYLRGSCDEYDKPPVMNFELHADLFDKTHYPTLQRRYEDMMKLTVSDGKSRFGRKFSDEEFYLYMTAHEFKHFQTGGTGIRSLADCYIFVKKRKLNWEYIRKNAAAMGMEPFERQRLILAKKLFSKIPPHPLSQQESRLLDAYLEYGIYGTYSRLAENRMERFFKRSGSRSKAAFILKQFISNAEHLERWYPFLKKAPYLLPVAYIMRLHKSLTADRVRTFSQLKSIIRYKKK